MWRFRKIISFLLIVSIMVSMVGCSGTAPNPSLSDPNSQIVSENIETENNQSKAVTIFLIILVIIGLVYVIFTDDETEEKQ